ncbi:MAG: hypothetical protein KJO07_08655 [Deltaproteobacteria bacterium]|nr:hypothetical protein [Deltaproteobacteria bacterium]
MMRWSFPLVMVLVSLMAQASAQAQSIYSPPGASLGAEAQATPTPAIQTVSYGREVAKVDAAAGALLLGAIVTIPTCFDGDCRAPLYLVAGAAGTWMLGPAIVHLSEGEPLRAGASLGLRVGLPVLAAAAFSGDRGENSGLGAALGMGTAMALDWFVLSKKTKRRAKSTARWAPTAAPAEGGATVGLAGSF